MYHEIFQFLYGTIKSAAAFVNSSSLSYFNSSMVQLKGVQFNGLKRSLFNFNSSMVQLKGAYLHSIVLREPFQFLYGTIKRGEPKRIAIQDEISIPLWYN